MRWLLALVLATWNRWLWRAWGRPFFAPSIHYVPLEGVPEGQLERPAVDRPSACGARPDARAPDPGYGTVQLGSVTCRRCLLALPPPPSG